MRTTQRAALVFTPIWASWLLALGYPFALRLLGWRPEAIGPEVPYLLLPPGAHTDVISSVSYFVWILVAGAVCCIPVEVAKQASRHFERPVLAYLLLLVFQLVLASDFVHTYAYDWWRYLLSSARITRIDALSWMKTRSATAPWFAGGAAVLVTVALSTLCGKLLVDRCEIARPTDAI